MTRINSRRELLKYVINIKKTQIKNSIDITPTDFYTILSNGWYNDKIINFYFQLLSEYANSFGTSIYVFSTIFYASLCKRGIQFVQKYVKKENIFHYNFVYIPVHRNNHWSFVNINNYSSEIEYFDSLNYADSITENIKKFLIKERETKKLKNVNYTIVHFNYPKQPNSFDCGSFVCLYAKNRCFGKQLLYDFEPPYDFRLKMAHEIHEGEILYPLYHKLKD